MRVSEEIERGELDGNVRSLSPEEGVMTEAGRADGKLQRKRFGSLALFLFCSAAVASGLSSIASAQEPAVTAIDVLLEPDATMVQAAEAANARLRQGYDKGYALDAKHAPHITLLAAFRGHQGLGRSYRCGDQGARVRATAAWRLNATGYNYAMWAGVAVTVIVVERSPGLIELQEKIIQAVTPFAVDGGTAEAFATSPESPDINPDTVRYVETFVPDATGAKYFPHVTVGVAEEDFVKTLMAEPFKPFQFSPAGVAIYQLGNFGTAQKKLWTWSGN